MSLPLPLIPLAMGSAGLVVLRDARALVAALMLQWLSLAWLGMEVRPTSSGAVIGIEQGSATEIVTAIVCGAIFAITLRNIQIARKGISPTAPVLQRPSLVDYLLPGAAVLLGGIAGAGFAELLPLGDQAQSNLAFYWTLLAATLALVLDGARNPAKLAAGLLALLNATALLVSTLSASAISPAILGLMAAIRIALAATLAYGWALLQAVFGVFSLEPLFASREEEVTTELLPPLAEGEAGVLQDQESPTAVQSSTSDPQRDLSAP